MGTFEEFFARPDIEQLRKDNPELSDILIGEFLAMSPDNVYGPRQEGTVVSWVLNQGKESLNPTYGRLPVEHFEFPTSHTEEVTVLKGTLEAEVGGNMSTLTRGQKVIAPPNSLLKLDVRSGPVFYFCQYK